MKKKVSPKFRRALEQEMRRLQEAAPTDQELKRRLRGIDNSNAKVDGELYGLIFDWGKLSQQVGQNDPEASRQMVSDISKLEKARSLLEQAGQIMHSVAS